MISTNSPAFGWYIAKPSARILFGWSNHLNLEDKRRILPGTATPEVYLKSALPSIPSPLSDNDDYLSLLSTNSSWKRAATTYPCISLEQFEYF